MLVTNNTQNDYVLPGGVTIAPGAADVPVDDDLYDADDGLALRINALDDAGSISVSSPPAGYPRSVPTPGAPPTGLPSGGSAGQALLKASGSDGDVEWGDVATDAPALSEVMAAGADAGGLELTGLADPASAQSAATRAYVLARISDLVGGAPGALDTLKELADALGDDASYAATITAALAGKQPLDGTLTALAALTIAADKLVYGTGADAFALADLTAFARTILDDADASTALSTLGVSTFVKTLLDDADAATARATLGISSGGTTDLFFYMNAR